MRLAVVLADDRSGSKDGNSPWFEARAGLFAVGEATEGQTAVRPVAGRHPATVQIFPPDCQDFLTDRTDILL